MAFWKKDEQKNVKKPMLGELAVEQGYASREDILFCLNIQAEAIKKGKDRLLGEIMIEYGFLSKESLKKLLKLQKSYTPK